MNVDENVKADAFGQRQAKHGLVLAEGERIVDSFDYDCYAMHDKSNSTMVTETTVMLTNKRLIHSAYSESGKRASKRNVEIPVDRIDGVSSYFKTAKRYCVWGIVVLSVLAVAFLVAGILSVAGVIGTVIDATADMLIAFGACVLAVVGIILSIVCAGSRMCFGVTVYTKDRPDVPCRVMCINKKSGYLADVLEKDDSCLTADMVEAESMVHALSNEIMQIKIENEAEEMKDGNNVG